MRQLFGGGGGGGGDSGSSKDAAKNSKNSKPTKESKDSKKSPDKKSLALTRVAPLQSSQLEVSTPISIAAPMDIATAIVLAASGPLAYQAHDMARSAPSTPLGLWRKPLDGDERARDRASESSARGRGSEGGAESHNGADVVVRHRAPSIDALATKTLRAAANAGAIGVLNMTEDNTSEHVSRRHVRAPSVGHMSEDQFGLFLPHDAAESVDDADKFVEAAFAFK